MKKILLLGDVNSSHLQKWATGIASLGYEAGIFSLSAPAADWFTEKNIKLLNEDLFVRKNIFTKNDFSKVRYLGYLKELRKAIRTFSPDILHAHYATSYGMLGALTGKHPFILSFWGSDVFEFPRRSIVHRLFILFVAKRADLILSASYAMKHEIGKYTKRSVEIIPLGIDTQIYFKHKIGEANTFTIGIIKSLEKYYGIDILLNAFAEVVKLYNERSFRLLVVGDGSREKEYKKLAFSLGIEKNVEFTGKVMQEMVPQMHNKIDLFICPSRSESFGVSVLEASACEVPVIVSNVGGLPEVVKDKETGLILESNDAVSLIKAIAYFLDNPSKLNEFGMNGRRFVKEKYEWVNILSRVQYIYESKI